MYNDLIDFIRTLYGTEAFIPLHAPTFTQKDKDYVMDAIDSTFVSSVGEYVNLFEKEFAAYVSSRYAVAVVNGTQALFIAMKVTGVEPDEEVLTQSLTFVATANAVSYLNAHSVFLDVDRDTLGLSPEAVERFLEKHAELRDGQAFNKTTGRRIAACVPMHTFGHPCRIDRLKEICDRYGIALVEDSAESLGSFYKGTHTGTVGKLGAFSFNGNKIMTTGGGGMIVTDDEALAKMVKHLTTTAKVPHAWEFNHDAIGYNFRMPNLNAALGVAQLEQLPTFLKKKRHLAEQYQHFFDVEGVQFITEPDGASSNYWLNAVQLSDLTERNHFLETTNAANVMTRPLWTPMHQLPMFKDCLRDSLENTHYLAERVVNIPSSVIL